MFLLYFNWRIALRLNTLAHFPNHLQYTTIQSISLLRTSLFFPYSWKCFLELVAKRRDLLIPTWHCLESVKVIIEFIFFISLSSGWQTRCENRKLSNGERLLSYKKVCNITNTNTVEINLVWVLVNTLFNMRSKILELFEQ